MKIFENQFVRYALILLIGIGIGAIFYPSKTITKEEVYTMEQKIERLETEKREETKVMKALLDISEFKSKLIKEESEKKVESLKEENFKLKHKVSEKRFKIVRPDGTIEEKWFKESETDVVSSVVTKIKSEFTRKVQSIENKWRKIHEQRISKIKQTYEKKIAERSVRQVRKVTKEKTEINKRSFGMSLGLTSQKDIFSSVIYDVYGPFFLDLHLESDREFEDKEIGLGIGLRF